MNRALLAATLAACGGPSDLDSDVSGVRRPSQTLAINEFRGGRGGFIEIANGSDAEVTLSSYAVDDADGGARPKRFTATIPAHGVVAIDYTGVSRTSVDSVRLLDAADNVIDALENVTDDRATVPGACFQRILYPWYTRYQNGWSIEGRCTRGELNTSVRPGDVIINELQPGGGFVEILNASDRVLDRTDLMFLMLDDGPGHSNPSWTQWPVNDLAPGAIASINFRNLSGTSRETLIVSTPEGLVIDSHDNFFAEGVPSTGRCYGRIGGAWASAPIACSPGQPNGGGISGSGRVVINEYQAGSTGFIELHNPGTAAIDLEAWSVDDVEGQGSAPRSISGITLEAGAFAAINYGGINKTSADDVRLVDASGAEIDRVATNGAPGTACFGRATDGGAWADRALSSCSRGASNGGAPAPTCSATGGSYGGVAFTATEECRALAFINDARFSELYTMGVTPAETAYFCNGSGCGTRRRRGWTSLREYDDANFNGGTPGRVALENLRSASQSWVDAGPQDDTIAYVWENRETLAETQVILERVYVERLDGIWEPNGGNAQCAIVRDAPDAPNFFRICGYLTSCHDGSCSGPEIPDLPQFVGEYVWLQARTDAFNGWHMHNLWVQQ